MEQFASGWKRNYYGKGDVIVYRLNRDGDVPAGRSPVFGANVLLLIYGDAFWPTYTTGDNTGLVATDSMKNFIQRETLNFAGYDLEEYCRFLAEKFHDQVSAGRRRSQVSATEVPYDGLDGGSGASSRRDPSARPRGSRSAPRGLVEAVSGIHGFKLLRLGGSAFHGFVRDEYTTLPDLHDRPLHMWLDLEWRYTDPQQAFNEGAAVARARADRARCVQVLRVGQHPAGDLPDRHDDPRRPAAREGSTPRGAEPDLGHRGRTGSPGCLHRSAPALRVSRPEAGTLMAKLSTHVLDTARGTAAAGVAIELHRVDAARARAGRVGDHQRGRPDRSAAAPGRSHRTGRLRALVSRRRLPAPRRPCR